MKTLWSNKRILLDSILILNCEIIYSIGGFRHNAKRIKFPPYHKNQLLAKFNFIIKFFEIKINQQEPQK